jgi:hypothetical protein
MHSKLVIKSYIPAPGIGPVTPSGARLPSIRRFASCFSSKVGLDLRMSGVWAALLGLWPMDMPTRTYIVLARVDGEMYDRAYQSLQGGV